MNETCDIRMFDDLTLHQLHALLCLRDLVFVVGQKITAEPEVDGRDPECHHAMLHVDGELVATARLFAASEPIVIGRVAVHPQWQRRGVGTRLMMHLHDWMGARTASLHAQAHLETWYRRLGWSRVGETFMEADIPHVHMVRKP